MAESLYINVQVYDEGVRAFLGSIIEHAGDITPAYADVGEAMRVYQQDMFDSQGTVSGEPWQQLSDETIRTKEQKGYPSDIEKATEEMYKSLVDDSAPLHVEEITPEFLRFGTEAQQAGYQQEGTSKMPARKIIDFNDLAIEGFTRIIGHYIMYGIVDQSLGHF